MIRRHSRWMAPWNDGDIDAYWLNQVILQSFCGYDEVRGKSFSRGPPRNPPKLVGQSFRNVKLCLVVTVRVMVRDCGRARYCIFHD